MGEQFFCLYCQRKRPTAGRQVLRWKIGKAVGKVRGHKCADCCRKANRVLLSIRQVEVVNATGAAPVVSAAMVSGKVSTETTIGAERG